MRVLIVEDSERLRKTVAMVLRESGYAVDESSDGEDGLWRAQSFPYDVIILDIMLPGLDGITALRQLRHENNPTQIILVSARDAIDDRVLGLREGADDYLVKPFALEELLARVEALCRRAYDKKDPILRNGKVVVDTLAKTVSSSDVVVDVKPREYAILEFLMMRSGQVVSRSEIEAHVYDDMVSPMSNVVDRAICALRKKLTIDGIPSLKIETRRGQGYVIEGEPS